MLDKPRPRMTYSKFTAYLLWYIGTFICGVNLLIAIPSCLGFAAELCSRQSLSQGPLMGVWLGGLVGGIGWLRVRWLRRSSM